MSADFAGIYARRAALLRELADLDLELARAMEGLQKPRDVADAVLTLEDAARFMGEPASTFRRRLEYGKALVSRPGERRKRYSRSVLERIKRDRLSSNELIH